MGDGPNWLARLMQRTKNRHRAIISTYLITFGHQTDNGEEMGKGIARKSNYAWLKAFYAAVLLPGLGVPITKWVESYYDVSFFSPTITSSLNAIESVGLWLVRDITISFWWLALLYLGSFLLAVLFLIFLYTKIFKKGVSSWETLTEDQRLVFAVIGEAIQNNHEFGNEQIRKHSGLSVISTRTAIDMLIHYGLIHIVRTPWGNSHFDLTFRGQQQFLVLTSLKYEQL